MNQAEKPVREPDREELGKLMSIRLSGLTFQERVELRAIHRRLGRMKPGQEGELKRLQERMKSLTRSRRERVREELKRRKGGDQQQIFYRYSYRPPRPPHIILPDRYTPRDLGSFIAQLFQQQQQQTQDGCTPIRFHASYSTFPGSADIQDVRSGLFGWSTLAGDNLEDTITGDGGQTEVTESLQLTWEGRIPAAGIYTIRRDPDTPVAMLFGRHRVIASGGFYSDYDASVSVVGTLAVLLMESNIQILEFGRLASIDSTRSEDREKAFGQWLDLPEEIVIVVSQPANVYLMILLNTELFADPDDDDSLAFLHIDAFGVPMNSFSDAQNLWRICP